MPLISIIVPVHKTQQYLDRCVQSIVNQTYRNLEIILVDDGSPDNCGSMCDAWAAKDSRIKVIHKENGGLSDARNAGLSVATGEYIGFVDSDDCIRVDMYQLLWENMNEHGSDISACGIELVWEDETPSAILTKSGSCVLDTQEAMQAVIDESWIKQPVWYKLYKTALIRDIPFPVGKYHEDVFWTYQAVGRAQKVLVFDTPCYFYTQRSGSIMGEGYSLKRLDSLEAKQKRLEYLQEYFPELVGSAVKDLQFSCMYAMQMCLKHLNHNEKADVSAKILDIWNQVPKTEGEVTSVKEKLWLGLAMVSLIGTCKLRNLLGIGF